MNAWVVFVLTWAANVGSGAGVFALARRHGALVSRGFLGRHIFTPNAVAHIEEVTELNIGYAIVCRAVLVGIERAVRDMKELIG